MPFEEVVIESGDYDWLKKWWQSDGWNLWKTGVELSKIMSCDDTKILCRFVTGLSRKCPIERNQSYQSFSRGKKCLFYWVGIVYRVRI